LVVVVQVAVHKQLEQGQEELALKAVLLLSMPQALHQ
jgi:hypothetical protein